MALYHGGVPGKVVGDVLDGTAAPHVEDGCPVCEARRAGRVCTVGEFVRWVASSGHPRAPHILAKFQGVPWSEPMDQPSARQAVYMTPDRDYARFYAARSKGDLYRVKPIGEVAPSDEDHFPTWTASSAVVVAVVERGVKLTRADRRQLDRRWKKADARVARERESAGCSTR